MSRSLFRSVMELRTTLSRLAAPAPFLLPMLRSRGLTTTQQHIEPTTPPTATPTTQTAVPPPNHYITVLIHGRPYLVTQGDSIRLPFLMPGVLPGDVLRLDRASTLGSRDFTLLGAPHVDTSLYECRAVVLGVESEPMRTVVKTKRRNRRSRRVKTKHKFTMLRISELKLLGPS
ncbi:hypothetical protein AAE478_002482 [Parahypoxylon ruwenzoriense]